MAASTEAAASLLPSDYKDFTSLVASLADQSRELYTSSSSNLSSHLAPADSEDALLKLKSALLLSYTQHLTLLSSHKLLGFSIDGGDDDDDDDDDEAARQGKALVRNLVSTRLALDKIRAVEARLKPRYERCVRAWDLEQKRQEAEQRGAGRDGQEQGEDEEEEDLDALSFRPNPSALLAPTQSEPAKDRKEGKSKGKRVEQDAEDDNTRASSSVYKPPKLAPVPYNENAQRRRRRDNGDGENEDEDDAGDARGGGGASARNRRALNAHLLQDMSSSLSSNPYAQSSSGLSRDKANTSKRARKLQEMEDFEEANFTRLVQSKKEQRKRRRDEEDVALGGVTTADIGSNRKVGGGFEEEFGDLLRGSESNGRGSRKEWDDLVSKRKRGNSRLQSNSADGPSGNGRGRSGGRSMGNRFEKAVKSHGKRSGR